MSHSTDALILLVWQVQSIHLAQRSRLRLSIPCLAGNSTAIIRVELRTDQFLRYHEDGLIGSESAMVEAAPGIRLRFVDLPQLHRFSRLGSGDRKRSCRQQRSSGLTPTATKIHFS